MMFKSIDSKFDYIDWLLWLELHYMVHKDVRGYYCLDHLLDFSAHSAINMLVASSSH